ncbi:(Fe-S)-binding protein [Nocardioides marinquilinus]|uniref:(Fe-S)-binding protein n=1 Tax=Nocardioides marinquilinus TaxID=1210400 RepID=A0ABP9PAS0_9ACTN
MEYEMALWVVIVGLLGTVVALALAGRRVWYLFRLISSGQPAPDRVAGVTGRLGRAVMTQVVEVFGQRKLLKWSVPGVAHAFVFWAFLILGTVYLEAYGILISRNEEWHIPLVGQWEVLGFAQDTIALLALVGIGMFAAIRLREAPSRLGRRSRFSYSHLGGAWVVLFMIFNVIWTLFLFRGAAAAEGHLPYDTGAYVSQALGNVLPASETLEAVGLLLHIGVMLVFLVQVVNSKHLHIFVAPLNVLFSRRPKALGAVKPMMTDGKPLTLDDLDDLDEDAKLGVGSVEDFTWKGLLDFATCTECGRCQSQCPAWNTEKPLSPKMLILNLRDHAFGAGPALLANGSGSNGVPEAAKAEAARPLVGETEGYAWEPTGGAVIDTDVLWSCVTCGACVEQCPVDIEHVDHIVDMRRYQVLVENSFPPELNQLFKGMENKGNPWNMSATARLDWAKDLPFEVKVVGEDIESLDEVEWLFWVGCAGAYEDRAKKTTRAVAELLDLAGVSFGVLGNGETCTGDSARRAGNEFVFQGLAAQNVEVLTEAKAKKVVSTCAHCFNTLKNEYSELGIELEVVHHTQLLNRLVREGKLTPVSDGAGAHKRSITYHDPCYIGRHNGVYSPPRELLQVLPGASFVEMERNSERSFCCGAGGARMWMEENIGSRINVNRTTEAVETGADQIAVGCPFCRVMLSDGLTMKQSEGEAREEVEVLDVAQMLLASVKGEQATRMAPGQSAAASNGAAGGVDVATKAEPEAGDATITDDTVVATEDAGPAAKASGGTSLFDTPVDEPPATTDPEKPATEEAKAAQPASSGGSLFDLGGGDDAPAPSSTEPGPAADPEPVGGTSGGSLFDLGSDDAPEPAADPEPVEGKSGGSLFDLGSDDAPEPAADPEPTTDPEPEASTEPTTDPEPVEGTPTADLGGGGSLFDIPATPEPEAATEPETTTDPEPETTTDPEPVEGTPAPTPVADLGRGGSLFDIAAPEPASAPEPTPAPAAEPATAPEPAADEAAPTAALGSGGGSLFDIAAPDNVGSSTSADPEPEATTDPEPKPTTDPEPEASTDPEPVEGNAEPTPEPEPTTDPEPVEGTQTSPEPDEGNFEPSNGPSHQPRTDVDITQSSSLFDL